MKELLLVEAAERTPQRLRRKALDLIDSLMATVGAQRVLDARSVHDARRRLKELRAVTTIVGRKGDARFFREAGRLLSAARDAKAALEGFDRLRRRFSSEWTPRQFMKIRRALAARIDPEAGTEVIGIVRNALGIERGRIAAWPVDEMRREDLWKALQRSYRRARRGMHAALERRSNEAIHEWRKRVKTHGYEVRFLSEAGLLHLEARGEELRRLSRALGELHDLDLIDDICRNEADLLGSARYVRLFRTYLARARDDLLARAEADGSELFRQSTREWLAALDEAEPRLRIGPRKSRRLPAPPAMLA